MEKAIRRAIEGGWEAPEVGYSNGIGKGFIKLYAVTQPEFWQALSKVEVWFDDEHQITYGFQKKGGSVTTPLCGWEYQMHQFADHLIDNLSVDDFFNELLK